MSQCGAKNKRITSKQKELRYHAIENTCFQHANIIPVFLHTHHQSHSNNEDSTCNYSPVLLRLCTRLMLAHTNCAIIGSLIQVLSGIAVTLCTLSSVFPRKCKRERIAKRHGAMSPSTSSWYPLTVRTTQQDSSLHP
jgi:hypothetical protein